MLASQSYLQLQCTLPSQEEKMFPLFVQFLQIQSGKQKNFNKILKIDFKTFLCNYLHKIFSYLYPIFFSILTSVIESKDRSRLSFSSFLYFSDVTWFFDGKRIDPPPEIVVEEPLTSNSFERVNNVST